MRELTSTEGNIVRIALAKRGIILINEIDTKTALHYWYMASSTPLSSLFE